MLALQSGYLRIDGHEYLIEPVKSGANSTGPNRHLLYKKTDQLHLANETQQDTCANQGAFL